MEHLCYCIWCHEPLPALADDASFVEELNHTIHDHCRVDRDAFLENRDLLMRSIAARIAAPIPTAVRDAYLEGVRDAGLVRRCPCLWAPEHGFRGFDGTSWERGDGRDDDGVRRLPGTSSARGPGGTIDCRSCSPSKTTRPRLAGSRTRSCSVPGPCARTRVGTTRPWSVSAAAR